MLQFSLLEHGKQKNMLREELLNTKKKSKLKAEKEHDCKAFWGNRIL